MYSIIDIIVLLLRANISVERESNKLSLNIWYPRIGWQQVWVGIIHQLRKKMDFFYISLYNWLFTTIPYDFLIVLFHHYLIIPLSSFYAVSHHQPANLPSNPLPNYRPVTLYHTISAISLQHLYPAILPLHKAIVTPLPCHISRPHCHPYAK